MRYLLFAVLFFSLGCYSPVITNFETAYLARQGQVQARGYYTANSSLSANTEANSQRHFGMHLGVGIHDRFTLVGQLEQAKRTQSSSLNILENYDTYRFIEGGLLMGIIENRLAAHLAVGNYKTDTGLSDNVLRSKLLWTFKSPRRKMSYTLHGQLLTEIAAGSGNSDIEYTDIIFGHTLSFSNDLDRWGCRLDFSSSMLGRLSAGVAVDYRFGGGATDLELAKAFIPE